MKYSFCKNILCALTILAGGNALVGCASAPPEPSLFVRLGGLPALTAVTDKSVDRISTDPRTRRSFEGIKLQPVKDSIVSLLCNVTGGPCKYEGATMSKAHEGLKITSAEFDAMVALLVETLDQFHVGTHEKADLLQILAPLKSDIVGK